MKKNEKEELNLEEDQATWTIPNDGWSDGGRPYDLEELDYSSIEVDRIA